MGADLEEKIIKYWEQGPPMSFEELTYEQKRAFRYNLQDYMHEAFRFEEWVGKEVLEIGCGSGIDAIEFVRYGAKVVATDITSSAIALTRALAEEAGVSITVVQSPADRIPYKDNTFDCVYSCGALHHIPDIESVLKEIQRILKIGGKVMIVLYNKDSLLYRLGYSERRPGCPYTKVYTKDKAKELFSSWFGNVTVDIRYKVIDTPEARKVKIDMPDEQGWHLIIKAIKK